MYVSIEARLRLPTHSVLDGGMNQPPINAYANGNSTPHNGYPAGAYGTSVPPQGYRGGPPPGTYGGDPSRLGGQGSGMNPERA